MARKLSEIAETINSSVEQFLSYLDKNLDDEVNSKIKELSGKTNVYIFSGVIRNFFLNIGNVRDVDLILKDEIDITQIFSGFEIVKNSFGGFKISKNEILIDLWFLEKTWAFQHQKILNFDLDKYIPATAFFNFSAIVFSYNEKMFYYTDDFLKFLRDKEIDVVYEANANYSLCVVNTFYYADKCKLKIADKLKKHIIYLDRRFKNDYDYAQMKHFGTILYPKKEIEKRLESLAMSLNFMMPADKFKILLKDLSKRPITDLGITDKVKIELFFSIYNLLNTQEKIIRELPNEEIDKLNICLSEYLSMSDSFFYNHNDRNDYLKSKFFKQLESLGEEAKVLLEAIDLSQKTNNT